MQELRSHRLYPSSPDRSARAFTLVELMVTIALIAILVAVTLPAMTRTMERIDARSTARRLANTFRQAREQAMSRGEVVLVEIQKSKDRGRLVTYLTENRALRCNGIDTSNDVAKVDESVSVAQLSGDMKIKKIASRKSGGTPNWLCFTPEGTIKDPDGDIIHHGTCPGVHFRMSLVEKDADVKDAAQTVGVSKSDLEVTGCPGSSSKWNKDKRRSVRNGRYLVDLWLIDVPYNGAIRALQ